MSDIVNIQSLSKAFKLYSHPWRRLLEWVVPFKLNLHREHWVLKGIDLQIQRGESLGIIGVNGAGKSTLLKIITGTSFPTEGSIETTDNIRALLELGMGFHPDFTGRENVRMSGQLMGYSNHDIDQQMQWIEDFAEIGAAIDEPVRTYSSGMQVRLAFSVATATRPDVLIVDEALSVGDAYFQHKCMSRIREFKKQGATLLFVSHDAAAVKSLCDRAVLLDKGSILKDGAPEEVLDFYNAMMVEHNEALEITQDDQAGKIQTRSGTGEARFRSVTMLNEAGEKGSIFAVARKVTVCLQIDVHASLSNPTVGIMIKDRLGNTIYGTNTFMQGVETGALKSGDVLIVDFNLMLNLGPGTYSIAPAIVKEDTHFSGNYDWWDNAFVFEVIPGNEKRFIGCDYMPVELLAYKEGGQQC